MSISTVPAVAQLIMDRRHRARNQLPRAQRLVVSLSYRALQLDTTVKRLTRRNQHLETEVANLTQRIRELEAGQRTQNYRDASVETPQSETAPTLQTIDEELQLVVSELHRSLCPSSTATKRNQDSQGIIGHEPQLISRTHPNASCVDEPMEEGERTPSAI